MIKSLVARPEFGPLVLLVLELVVFSAINPQFISAGNIGNTLTFTVELGLIALPMTLLMTAGEFDLSVGSVFGFSAVMMWTLFNAGALPLELAFLATLVAAAFIGFVNASRSAPGVRPASLWRRSWSATSMWAPCESTCPCSGSP